MQHEAFVDFAIHHLDLLLVISGPEGGAHQCLGFPTCEYGGAVHARQETDLGPDRPDVAELPAVKTLPSLEDLVAQDLFLECAEAPLDSEPALNLLLRH